MMAGFLRLMTVAVSAYVFATAAMRDGPWSNAIMVVAAFFILLPVAYANSRIRELEERNRVLEDEIELIYAYDELAQEDEDAQR